MNQQPKESYTRRIERRKRLLARMLLLLALVIVALMAMSIFGADWSRENTPILLIMVLLLNIIGNKVLSWSDRAHTGAKWASRGAEAEEAVQKILSGLNGDEYYVINDIPSPNGNIDHIVIARHGGVFLIETKSTKGRVEASGNQLLINGNPILRDPIQQVLRNTMWFKEKIGEILGEQPYITAVLLFTEAFVAAKKPIRGVLISRPQFLFRVLNSPPASSGKKKAIRIPKTPLIKNKMVPNNLRIPVRV